LSTEARPTEAAPVRVLFPQVQAATQSDAQDRGFTQGHAAGYAAGLRAAAAEQERKARDRQAEYDVALASARESSDRAVALLAAAGAAFQQRFELVLQDAEAVLAAGTIDLAEAVLGYELHDGERTARAALRRALSAGRRTEESAGNPDGNGNGLDVQPGQRTGPDVAAVRLNPADLQVLEATGAVTAARAAGVELVPDPALARGDAMARYPDGWLDARLGAALDRARAVLLDPQAQALPPENPGGRP
jgi:flagellar assembly protein FliH